MPESKKSGGTGLKKKLGPLPLWGWMVAGGVGFIGYRFLRARSAATSAVAATGTTGGGATGTIPIGGSGAGGATGVGAAGTFASTAAWTQAALGFLTGNGLSPGDAYSAVTSFLNGNCVSQAAYNALAAMLDSTTVGLPPGLGTAPPALQVCPSPAQTPTPSNPTPPTQTTTQLPPINAQLFPLKVLFGQYGPNDYTQVGTVTNGVYQGKGVTGGAPVYANVFGGFVQDFDMASLPNGTGIYVPTALLPYVAH